MEGDDVKRQMGLIYNSAWRCFSENVHCRYMWVVDSTGVTYYHDEVRLKPSKLFCPATTATISCGLTSMYAQPILGTRG